MKNIAPKKPSPNLVKSSPNIMALIAGERIHAPARAVFNIEHERGSDGEEIEFQMKWKADK